MKEVLIESPNKNLKNNLNRELTQKVEIFFEPTYCKYIYFRIMMMGSDAEDQVLLTSASNPESDQRAEVAGAQSSHTATDQFTPKNYVKVIVNFGQNNYDNVIRVAKMKIEAKQR